MASYELSDARRLAAEAPYTFFLPHDAELDAVGPGDHVKLIFELVPPGENWGAERMWVLVTSIDGGRMTGTLDNEPHEAPLRLGDLVGFGRENIIAISWADPSKAPEVPAGREYWDRCMVDDCVLKGEEPVEYVYRETPDLGGDGEHPDSGWRIRGRQGAASDEDMEQRDSSFVALGAVLNRDDSWLPLIDAPIGSAFMRDWTSGRYVPQGR